MERLTDCAQGYCEVYCDHYTSCFSEPDVCKRKHEVQLYERLKAYESTGLEPENMAHWEEQFIAECEGRLLVLPCKVGDTVFRLITPMGGPATILETQIKTLGQAADLVGRVGKKNLLISVFLTREEAEAALEGGGADAR